MLRMSGEITERWLSLGKGRIVLSHRRAVSRSWIVKEISTVDKGKARQGLYGILGGFGGAPRGCRSVGRERGHEWLGVTVLSNTAALVFSVFHMGFYVRFQGQRALRLNQILGNHLSGRSPFFRACDSEELAVNYG